MEIAAAGQLLSSSLPSLRLLLLLLQRLLLSLALLPLEEEAVAVTL